MNSEKVKEIKIVLKGLVDDASNWLQNAMIGGVNLADILTLINELESENERLENKNYQLEQDLGQCENGYKLELHTARYQLHSANEDLKKAEKRIAELEKENKRLNKAINNVQKGFDNGEFISKDYQTKTLKQFVKKVKEKYGKSCSEYYPILIEMTSDEIDELLKEYESGK